MNFFENLWNKFIKIFDSKTNPQNWKEEIVPGNPYKYDYVITSIGVHIVEKSCGSIRDTIKTF